jgi:hypothetical protein
MSLGAAPAVAGALHDAVEGCRFRGSPFVVLVPAASGRSGTAKERETMAKYLLVYGGGSMAETEEAQAQVMAAWDAWFHAIGGAVVDPGNPTGEGRTVRADGSVGAAAEPTTGYSVINAADLDAAVGIAKGCPVLGAGGSVEVCEVLEVM